MVETKWIMYCHKLIREKLDSLEDSGWNIVLQGPDKWGYYKCEIYMLKRPIYRGKGKVFESAAYKAIKKLEIGEMRGKGYAN